MGTYCGKSCDTCTHREQLNCPGCAEGPGKAIFGDCKIAACCREKGHQTCDTCIYQDTCPTFQQRLEAPQERMQNQIRIAAHQEELRQRAVLPATWFWVAFWLFIPNMIAVLITNEQFSQFLPFRLVQLGSAVSLFCLLLYSAAYWKLSPINSRFRNVAICGFVIVAIAVLTHVFPHLSDLSAVPLVFLFAILPLGFTLYSEYQEYTGCSEILSDVDAALSRKWRNLWTLFLSAFIALPVTLLLTLLAPGLALAALLILTIILVIASILKLVYLYKTAVLFRTILNSDPA